LINSSFSTSSEHDLKEIKSGIDKLEIFETSSKSIEQEILGRINPENQQIIESSLNFLSSDKMTVLVEKIGKLALKNFRDKYSNQESISFHNEHKQKFFLEIQQYIRLIRNSILIQDNENLQVPRVHQTLPYPDIYVDTLKNLKDELPEDLNFQSKKEIKNKIDYLIGRISK
jgi:hypothetical protein